MKQKLLALAIASAVTLPTLSIADDHAGGPQIYGRADLAVKRIDDGGDAVIDLDDNASRIGVKGEEDLGGLKGIYQFEFAVDVSDGSGIAKSRDSFVGLKGDFGTVFAGRFDTPFKKAQGKTDLFSDQLDIKSFVSGEERKASSIGYKTPDFNGLSVFAAFLPGEEATDNLGETQDGIADGVSVMAKYETEELFAALAYDMNVEHGFWEDIDATPFGTNNYSDGVRATGGIKLDNMGFNILGQVVEQADIENPAEQTAVVLSGYTMVDQTKFEIQYGQSTHEQEGSVVEIDIDFLGLGVEQKLSKRTTLYGIYGMQNIEDQTGAESELDVAMIGAQHKF